MSNYNARPSIRFIVVLSLLLGFIALSLLGILFTPAQASSFTNPNGRTESPDQIVLANSLNASDHAYWQDSLEFLRAHLSQWYDYILAAQPMMLEFDSGLATHGRAAIGKCCDERGYGRITFGYRFGTLTFSSEPDSESPFARQAIFLSTLAHEATHLRDQRAGQFLTRADYRTCIAAESAGLKQQLALLQDLSTLVTTDQVNVNENDAYWLTQEIRQETLALHSRELWDLYCGDWLPR